MLVRLLSNQIRDHEVIINETIDKTIPEYQEKMRTKLFEELLFGTAQCWLLTDEYNKFNSVCITKVEEDTATGGKKCVLISGYAPNGITNGSASVYAGWEVVSKFASSQGCDRIAMYTNNPEVTKYLHMFDRIWQTEYHEIRLNKEN